MGETDELSLGIQYIQDEGNVYICYGAFVVLDEVNSIASNNKWAGCMRTGYIVAQLPAEFV